MAVRVSPWLAIPFRWIFGGAETKREHRRRIKRPARQDAMACESLEDRVVLSGRGDTLVQGFSSVGAVTGPIATGGTIEQSGYWFEGQNLQKAVSELANAVARGNDTTQAHTNFTALFNGSSVPPSAIDATFNELVQAIKDSGVSAADLTTVASERAASQTDLTTLSSGDSGG
jgi:hypothetical protein